ncbi:MAG: type 2 isopentenyl-diphosphate Delta-isomerase [Alphaproteobacteria bacterium]|nr:type 2 isopentenyl-diphosphate Delta-isomerase [Alphaproteobacteria bacterium]MCB9695584.1 type 2 isopentenyl-diphosphate Delta-isomerase [Alphaproteobacteria bacterium]
MSDIGRRKDEHLDLCATDAVAFKERTTLLDEVDLVHDALPERAVSEIDLSTPLVGRTLRAPLVIAAMTGGTARAAEVNRALASVAEELGIGFGFGSMRPLLEDPSAPGYAVRDVAPNAVVLGNIGVVQARASTTAALASMVERTGCDALCVHLNPAMEVIQPGGDDDFRGGLDTIARLVRELPVPVVAKETGCGLSRSVGQRLVDVGVRWVDTSGAGGTSWVGVETLRAKARTRRLGELFWEWGIPTAASVAQLADLGLGIVATGGVRHGLDIGRALALGATAGGIARPFLTAWVDDGRQGVLQAAETVIDEIRVATLLAGAGRSSELASRPLVVGPALRRWIPRGTALAARVDA